MTELRREAINLIIYGKYGTGCELNRVNFKITVDKMSNLVIVIIRDNKIVLGDRIVVRVAKSGVKAEIINQMLKNANELNPKDINKYTSHIDEKIRKKAGLMPGRWI